MKLNGKQVDLLKLQGELSAAGIPVSALGTHGDDLFTYDTDGMPLDLPAEAATVVADHNPSLTAAVYAQREREESLGVVSGATDLERRVDILQKMTVGVPQ